MIRSHRPAPSVPGGVSIGVVGSSARAAVHSLARAGVSAWAVDQFADRDLKRVAPCAVCPPDGYPGAIPELARQFPPGPVLYTGGLENHPSVVAELAKAREVWGTLPEALARVRDPFALFPALERAGFPAPRLVPRGEPCPREGRWLRKPFASGGGIGIRFARPGEAASPAHYFQEWVEGAPRSAVFVNGELLGITEQLIGEPWLHAEPFVYCGNIGPIEFAFPSPELGLAGVWGLDFIATASGVRPIEVNPRYTAAVEVLEHANQKSLFLPLSEKDDPPPSPLPEGRGSEASWESRPEPNVLNAASELPLPSGRGLGGGSSFSPLPFREGGPGGVGAPVGKAIYYAPHFITFPASGPWDADLAGAFDPWRLPEFADIPDAGSAIPSGWPVLTFFATGRTVTEVRERLQLRAEELDRLFAEQYP